MKAAIVTGGGYGIGRAVCHLLAQDGWNVVSVDRDRAKNDETARTCGDAGGTIRPVAGLVSDARAAEEACRVAEATGDTLKALVNCAALRHPGTICDITEAQWDETLDACLKGTFLFAKAAIARMVSSGGGAIVNFSSTDAQGRRGMIAYATAKGAIETFTKCLAADHLDDRIRVNAVVPPFTLTGMTEHYPPERLARMDDASPSGRAARPIDVARLVRFLVSDEAAALSGGIYGGTPPSR